MRSCPKPRSRGVRRRSAGVRPCFEALEARHLLSAPSTPLTPPEVHPDDTLDAAADLGALSPGSPVQAAGVIGDSPAAAADVDWYQFTVDQAALQVSLRAQAPVVLSLYNSDPGNFTDPYERLGHRLIAQDEAPAGGAAEIDRALAPGTYYVAVSGAGNRSFNPFLAASGYDGQQGPYTLLVSAADPGLDPTAGPVVLASDPADQAVLARAPSVLRIDLSGALDTDTTPADQIVHLTYSPDGTFDGSEPDLPLADVEFSAGTDEILLTPAAPLAPGYYSLSLLPPDGMDLSGPWPTDGSPVPLLQPWTITFQVSGVEGNSGPAAVADDAPAGARELGDVTTAGLVQAAGSIGDDPTAPPTVRPAADVDLYHFRVNGPGTHSLTAEVFAGRLDSPLNPGLSLFRLDPSTNRLVLVAGNDDTGNPTTALGGRAIPLRGDAALFAGLTAGDYYLAVSSSGNVPNQDLGILPGQLTPRGRVFDPNVSHSGTAGTSTGDYVLNLLVQPAGDAPRVLSASPGDGSTLGAPPTTFQVQFSKAVNIQQLAYDAYQQSHQGALAAVYVVGPNGARYSPRFVSYDAATNTANLLMFDALPNGSYQLHLSGPLGLSGGANDPLVGNDPSGDYVVNFRVAGPARGSPSDPLTWRYVGSHQTGTVHEQALGVLFPDELAAGVNVVRQPSAQAPRNDMADAYDFEVLQSQNYLFTLSGANLPAGIRLYLFDAAGDPVPMSSLPGGVAWRVFLPAGGYRVVLQGWSPSATSTVGYDLSLAMVGSPDSPVPLTSGPVPAIRLRLLSPDTPPAPEPTPPPGTTNGGAPTSPPQLTLPVTGTTPGEAQSPSTLQVSFTPPAADPAQSAPATPPSKPAAVEAGSFPLGLADKREGERGRQGEGETRPVSSSPPLPLSPSPPLSLLAVLGTSPAGPVNNSGVLEVSAPAPRLTLQLPEVPLPEALTHLLLLTPWVGAGGEDEQDARGEWQGVREDSAAPSQLPVTPPATPTPVSRRPVEWPRDLWFTRLGWGSWSFSGLSLRVPSQGQPRPAGNDGAGQPVGEDGPAEVPASALPTGRSWALGLAVLMAGGLGGIRKRDEDWERVSPRRYLTGKGANE